MQSLEPSYQSLPKSDDHASVPVRRRPPKTNSNRLTNIVSMYIPSFRPTDQPIDQRSTERDELLTHSELSSEVIHEAVDSLYDINLLFRGKTLIKELVDGIASANSPSTGEIRKITSIAADRNTIYITLEELPYVFLLKPPERSASSKPAPAGSVATDCSVKGYIQLHIPQVGDIVPKEICVYSPKPESTVMYIVGWVKVLVDESNCIIEKRWLLTKFALNGNYLARTPVYPYERYSGIAVDTRDGQLLLTCPRLVDINSFSENKQSLSAELSAGQLCKLTAGFERRVFSITMGNDLAVYRPDYVSQESAGHCCWASVERYRCIGLKSDKENDEPITSRRLFAFPGRQPEGEAKRSPREWLHVASWDFADLTPGRITAFDSDRLLVIDANLGTLAYITWNDGCETPTLHRITRPGTNHIYLLCSDFHSIYKEDIDFKPLAYFVAGSNIYSFTFIEEQS